MLATDRTSVLFPVILLWKLQERRKVVMMVQRMGTQGSGTGA